MNNTRNDTTPRTVYDPANGLKVNSGTHNAGSTCYERIDAYIERQMKRLKVPGVALACIEGDKIVHLQGFGKAHPGGEAPNPQTPFFIGSLTKSVTALAVMQLVEAGKIELDAPIQRYLPWFRVADVAKSAQMTVRHLLNQTSGLSVWSGWIPLADFDGKADACERQARALSNLKLSRPVGASFEYSNMNYSLLGLIIEAVSAESYEEYIQTNIFTPLEMHHSFTTRAGGMQNGLAMGHRYWFGFPVPAPNLSVPYGSLAAGELISCAEDMAHFLIANLNKGRYGEIQILSPAGIAELHRPAVDAGMMGIKAGQYAMGWYNEDQRQTRFLWHTGIVPDFFAYMALQPGQHRGVIILFNAYHFMLTPALTEIGFGVNALLAGDRPAPLRFGFMPWAMRGLLIIPALQITSVAATWRLLRRWWQVPASRPKGGRKWGRIILFPLIPNLLLALALIPMKRGIGGFLRLFFPDASWIADNCGRFAVLWSFLRTGLVLRTLRKPVASQPFQGGSPLT